MQKFDESEIQKVLSATREPSPEEKKFYQAQEAEHARLRAHQRSITKNLSKCLVKAGLDMAEYDKIRHQNETEIHHFLEKQKAYALQNSAAAKNHLRHRVNDWRQTIEFLKVHPIPHPPIGPVKPVYPNYVALETPFFIFTGPVPDLYTGPSWPTLYIDSTHIEPWNNVAKVNGFWARNYNWNESVNTPDGYVKLSFYFLWQNPSDKYAVIDVASSLVLNGWLYTFADGGFLGFGGKGALQLDVYLCLYEWWKQQPNQFPTQYSPQQTTQHQYVTDIPPVDGGWNGADKQKTVKGKYDLSYTEMIVDPSPQGVVVFEVMLQIYTKNDSAGNTLDFSTGDFEVMCPALVLNVLT
jgi:hypothetical protein